MMSGRGRARLELESRGVLVAEIWRGIDASRRLRPTPRQVFTSRRGSSGHPQGAMDSTTLTAAVLIGSNRAFCFEGILHRQPESFNHTYKNGAVLHTDMFRSLIIRPRVSPLPSRWDDAHGEKD